MKVDLGKTALGTVLVFVLVSTGLALSFSLLPGFVSNPAPRVETVTQGSAELIVTVGINYQLGFNVPVNGEKVAISQLAPTGSATASPPTRAGSSSSSWCRGRIRSGSPTPGSP
jgi:hypothetical protein